MRFAIWEVADQTWAYLSSFDRNDQGKTEWTVKYSEAVLLDSRDEAEALIDQLDLRPNAFVEEVADEATWRQNEDTW